MKPFFLVLFLIVVSHFSFSKPQSLLNAGLDMPLTKIMAMPNDTNKLRVYFSYADTSSYLKSNHAQLLLTSTKMDLLAEKLHASKYVLAYYFLVYHYNFRINNHIIAFNYINKAFALATKLGDLESIVHALNHVAGSYLFMVEYGKALETYKLALSTSKKIKNKEVRDRAMASVLTRTAKFYSERFKKYHEALLYDEQAVDILKNDKNDFQLGYAYAQLAKDNFNLKYYLPAYNYAQLYLKTSTIKDGMIYSEIFNTLGKIYSNAPDSLLNRLGISHTQRSQKAIALFNQSIKLSKENDDYLPNISQGLKDLSEQYATQGDFEKAYHTYQSYIVDRDSLENQRAKRTLLQMQFYNDFHEQTNSLKFKERLASAALHTKQIQSYYFVVGIVVLVILSFFIFRNYKKADFEKQRSNNLLLNILPANIAEELKEHGSSKARMFNEVTVLFTDFVNFTNISEQLTPTELVSELHFCFKAFDNIMEKHGIEKIKTIGDAYLAVAGLPNFDAHHAKQVVTAAMEITAFIKERKAQLGDKTFNVRVGIHSGSVVAGIVGVKKFAYDIWGDTVNTAARMEQNSEPGKINVSQKTYDLVKNQFAFIYRGEIEAKHKGKLKMYFVEES